MIISQRTIAKIATRKIIIEGTTRRRIPKTTTDFATTVMMTATETSGMSTTSTIPMKMPLVMADTEAADLTTAAVGEYNIFFFSRQHLVRFFFFAVFVQPLTRFRHNVQHRLQSSIPVILVRQNNQFCLRTVSFQSRKKSFRLHDVRPRIWIVFAVDE